ncbi:monovalent cation/H+ antiporter subunit D [Ancylobacter mangrovi]|uniref:Monovalent cation/H+ antiporter subunit D n=1 Tax=Ancylobacter mangrovi TaxID=2972472 RepID=A0A9X2PAG8_9HYPH|nr:monovalent cation/H+ antiporter subunit D [Ancylobacter mangrovi]MCS0493774.1 monovalent cation/H+ antiporter subunit D [Ancylobacter mangrovi]MCS0501529.1 monovalent cation/H+ antiporter subunit D [Ancylobacter mangrovi]
MGDVMRHLVIAPVLLPLAVGAFLLMFDDRRRTMKMTLSLGTVGALLVIAVALVVYVDTPSGDRWSSLIVYPLGNWRPPFGIVLVADRLSALMVLVTAVLGAATLLFAMARWHRAGPRFYTLFLLLLTGLNGAFLTGDVFNLFVFFEILLAASYGLVLHGSGTARVKAGLHYIPINLVASSLFLIGVSLIYGVTGTLNMADLARLVPDLPDDSRVLFEAGAAVLGVAFLVKAGMWPLSFWLPTTYAASCAPVAAMFAIMTKVGIYVILRLFLLCFGDGAGASADFGAEWLYYGGMATIAFGGIGVLASQSMPRLGGYSVLVSSGTLLAAIGTTNSAVISGALFYLVSSTFTIGAYFLLVELIERGRQAGADVLAVTMEVFGDPEEDIEDEEDEVGVAIPAAIAVLGGGFLACTALLAGMPPLSGFIAKFAMLSALINEAGDIPPSHWALVILLVLSGLATLIAMTRTGIRTLWGPDEIAIPRVRAIEAMPVAVLLFLCAAMTVMGGPAMRYMEATAQLLYWPQIYAQDVLGSLPPRPPTDGGHE